MDIMRQGMHETRWGVIRYWVDAAAGPGAPWLVLLPGLTADHRLFEDQLAHFSGRANCLVWDPPAHGASRPFTLDFTMDDMARMLAGILDAEGVAHPVLVGQSMGGYVSQAFCDLFPGRAVGFASIDSAPLRCRYYPTWEIKVLRHTKWMYQMIPWSWLASWGAWGTAVTSPARTQMRQFMEGYTKKEYVELAAFGYRLLADAVEANRAYELGCPTLLLCGEHDRAGDVKPFNRRWAKGEGLPLVWVPDAGHNSNVDNPSFVNAQIEGLLERVVSGA